MASFNFVVICFYLFINVISCEYGNNLYSIYLGNPPSTLCTPGQYVVVDCNVCKCGPDGHIDDDHCTQNNCNNDEPKTRNLPKGSRRTEVPGSCKPNTWYSMGPCQFCFCSSKNKLVCNSEDSRESIILGTFSLKVCGTGMGDEIQDLQKDRTNSKDRIVVLPQQEPESKKEGLRTSYKDEPEEPYNTIDSEQQRNKYSSKSSEESRDKDERHKPDSNEDRYEKRRNEINENNENNNDDDDNARPTEERNDYDSDENMTKKNKQKIDVDDSENGKKHSTHSRDRNKKHKDKDNSNRELLLETDPEELTRHAKNKTIDVAALPALLDKFLKMAVRKSLMSLRDTNATCEPGTTWRIKCNSCYCLKNGKTMCTQLVCKDK